MKEHKIWRGKMISIECLNLLSSPLESKHMLLEGVAPIREERKTLNEHLADTTEKMKDAITAKQQQQQQPADESNVLEQYLLKYGGSSRVDGKTWMDIHIPTGCYEIKAINNELQRFIMKKIGYKEDEKRIILSPNPNSLRCVLEILHGKCRVDFNVDESLCKVLGFSKKIYKAGRYESENIVNILASTRFLYTATSSKLPV